MNSVGISFIISLIYVLAKMALQYKENPRPNVKDGVLVFLSSMAGFYATDYFSLKPKVTDVFTEAPNF
jgi:hypothetical protein